MSRHATSLHWQQCRLCDVAEITKGKKPRSFTDAARGSVPYLEAAFVRGQREPQFIALREAKGLVLADSGDTLILWDGANAGDVFRGQTGVVASTMARVRVATVRILPDFLYFCVSIYCARLRETAAGSTIPHVRGRVAEGLQIPVPPLPVQERIVQVLQRADEIQRKRQEALETADAILPASFVAMFGDPTENAGRFGRVPLGELADVRAGVAKGGRKFHGAETVDVPYLRVANVQDGFLDLSEVKTIEVLPGDVDRFHLEDGDILMTEGGDPDKLGRGCVWRGGVENCIHQNHIFRVRTHRDKLLPEYLAALLRTQYAKHYFLSCAKRSSNLASVNARQVRAFAVPVPTINEQRKFVSAVEQWVEASAGLVTGLKDADALFTSLANAAFSGELTAEWEAANADWIAAQSELQERLPRLALLALVREQAARAADTARAIILVTALMKYAFLLQMEGNGRRQFYHFIPYHYGPFAKEVYADLERLQADGLVTVDEDGDEDRTRITLADPGGAEAALAELPDDLKEGVTTILNTYGDLDHKTLLRTVYEKYPAYARVSRVRGRAPARRRD